MQALTVTAALALLGGISVCPAFAQDAPPAPAPSPAPPTPAPPAPAPPIPEPTVPQPAPSPAPATPAPAPSPTPSPQVTDTKPASDTKKDKSKKNKTDKASKDGKSGMEGKDLGDEQYVPQRNKGTAEKLFGPLFRDITITGGFSTRLQQNSVEGTSDGTQRFTDTNGSNYNYRSVGPVQNNVDVTVQGKVFNAFDVNARLSNARYGTFYNQKFNFNYHNRDNTTKLALGSDVNATMPGNQFATFSRSVQGIRIERDFGKWQIGNSNGLGWKIKTQGVASLTRAVTRRGTFRGQGTSGPYFLNAGSLIEGSIKVQLNDEALEEGKDYRIDFLLGQINFLNGRLINAQDTVTFTYEAQNFNTTPGLLTGSRFDIADPKGNAYGVTYIQQKATGQRVRNGDVEERYPVIADPTYRYAISSVIDTAYPVRIQWYNRQLIEGVDYILNKELRYFQLITTALPPDSAVTYNGNPSLKITYRPVRQTSLSGDRSVLGIDSTYRITQNGNVSFDLGRSESILEKQQGQALSVRTTWNGAGKGDTNRWQFVAGLKNVGETFSTIDSTSGAFLQPERNVNTSVNFSPNKFFTFGTSLTQGQVGNRSYATTNSSQQAIVWAGNQSWDFKGQMLLPHAPTLNFSHRQTVQNSAGSRNSLVTTDLTSEWAATSKLHFDTGLTRTTSHGQSIYASAYNNNVTSTTNSSTSIVDQLQDTSGSRSVTNSTADTSRFAVTYVPMTWLTLAGNLGFSRSYATTSATTSRSTGLSITAAPTQTLSLNAALTESGNGQSTTGYYNTSSSGSSSIIPTNSYGQRTRITTFGVQYAPTARLNGLFNINNTLSLVPGYDNTQSSGLDWSVNTAVSSRWQFTVTGMEQKTRYVGGQGDSSNRSLSLTTSAGPFGRVKMDATVARMNFGSASYYSSSSSTSGTTPSTKAIYSAIGNTRATTYSGTTYGGTGYIQSGDNTSLTFNADYALGRRYSLVGRWQTLDQSAPSTAGSSGTTTSRAGTNFFQGQGSLGLDIRLTEILGFRMDMNYVSLKDREDSRYSYRAKTFTADLSARF